MEQKDDTLQTGWLAVWPTSAEPILHEIPALPICSHISILWPLCAKASRPGQEPRENSQLFAGLNFSALPFAAEHNKDVNFFFAVLRLRMALYIPGKLNPTDHVPS